MTHNLHLRAFLLSTVILSAASAAAQDYTYRPESFEGSEWSTKAATVTSSTGKWTTNKNISTTAQAQDGSASLLFSSKDGLTTPLLPEGAGSIIYYALDQNRQAYVETSTDGSTWETVESYKETTDWTKHTVEINDKTVKYIRIRTTSNNQFYVDNVLVTKTDGTDADGNVVVTSLTLPYFTNTFEDRTTYPASKDDATSPATFDVPGQGEWIYYNAYRNTNASYLPDGSTAGLRMLKNGSYIISPVVSQGVVKVSFDEGRSGRKLTLYTSTDEGATWTAAKQLTSETNNTILISDQAVNRVKLANESTSDADIDNFSMTAFPSGTPATVATGVASRVTSSTAVIAVSIVDPGDRDILETGVCWAVGTEPTVKDNTVSVAGTASSINLSGLPAGATVNYRAYALSLAGLSYGEVKQLTTAGASVPAISTGDIKVDEVRTDETDIYVMAVGRITDNGGDAITEVGYCFSTDANPTVETGKVTGYVPESGRGEFTVYIPLKPATTYYLAPYAVNSVGIAYGQVKEFTTGEIVIPDYPHNVYYCDPAGDDATADGSEAKPFRSLQLAVDRVQAGDIIYMNAGTYNYSERINIPTIGAKNSGMIRLFARNGRAVLDFSAMAVAESNQGIRMSGSYWHVYGLDICNAGDNGMLIERNKPSGGSYADIAANVEQAHDNIIENCRFIRNADTGLQMKNLATYNKVINCDAFYNTDPDHGDADGFAVKLSHGEGNYFYGCRAWNNSDDGWDQFIKKEGGFPDDITTTLEYCWAFNNGYLEDGTQGNGNGNGFKMGSDQGRNNVIMNRCLAFQNVNKGFDQNHNTGHMILNNCTGYSSKDTSSKSRFTYRLDEPTATGRIIRLTNCVAISDGISDRNKSEYAPHSVTGTLITSDLNTLPSDYMSIDPSKATADRQEDGSLPVLSFMRIAEGNTKLIDAGSEVAPFDGESRWSEGIRFNGAAPDLGCFETGGDVSGIEMIGSVTPSGNRLSLVQANCGLVILTVEGASCTDEFTLNVYDINGRLVAARQFNGSTTSVELPHGFGMLIVNVTGAGVNESLKLKI